MKQRCYEKQLTSLEQERVLRTIFGVVRKGDPNREIQRPIPVKRYSRNVGCYGHHRFSSKYL